MKLEIGMYCYNKANRKMGIGRIVKFTEHNCYVIRYKNYFELVSAGNIVASFNPIDLIEYRDLLVPENPIKLYGRDIKVALFSPVRCDGFTTFEDGTHCIILDLDYLVNVDELKIKKVLTHEQLENNFYTVGD